MTDSSTECTGPAAPRLIAATSMLILHVATASAAVCLLLHVESLYLPFLEKENVELPVITILLMDLSRSIADYWHVVLPLGAVLDALFIALILWITGGRTWLLSLYSHFFLVSVILFMVWIILAFADPVGNATRNAAAVGHRPTASPITSES